MPGRLLPLGLLGTPLQVALVPGVVYQGSVAAPKKLHVAGVELVLPQQFAALQNAVVPKDTSVGHTCLRGGGQFPDKAAGENGNGLMGLAESGRGVFLHD